MIRFNQIIAVACHMTLKAEGLDPLEKSSWVLESYQEEGHFEAFIAHVLAAAALALSNPHAMLIFTGGVTRQGSNVSEAVSYKVLLARLMPAARSLLEDRVYCGEYATDSLTNLAESLAIFNNVTGKRPESVVVVGFCFKERRFNHHWQALRLGAGPRFEYHGVNDPNVEGMPYVAGEARTMQQFLNDPLGVAPDGPLRQKRIDRNPLARHHCYSEDCACWPELQQALQRIEQADAVAVAEPG